MSKVAYVEHPITKQEKLAIKRDGFKIVDIRFKPEKLEDGDKVIAKQKTKAQK